MFGPQPLPAQSLRRIHQVSPRASLPRSGFVHGEGFRVPAGVRKPLMQEPAVGTLWLWGFVFWGCQGVNSLRSVYWPDRVDDVLCGLDSRAF